MDKTIYDHYTHVEATLRIKAGINKNNARNIIDECEKYGRDVILEKKCIVDGKEFSEQARAGNIVDLICLVANYGSKISIYVEGKDYYAEVFAKRIKFGLETESEKAIRFPTSFDE